MLDYKRGAWRIQTNEGKTPTVLIPIILYHGEAKWDYESFDSYFGVVEPEFLRFLSCFDYILVNLQKYPDKTIRAFDSFFLQKMLLSFKHCWDESYLKIHIVELLVSGFSEKKDEQTRRFLRILGVYLTNVSGMTKHEVIEEVNKSNNNFKSEAMSIFEDFIEQGIEQGIAKEKQESILRGWKRGISPSLIANFTGLSIPEVEKVIADYKAKS